MMKKYLRIILSAMPLFALVGCTMDVSQPAGATATLEAAVLTAPSNPGSTQSSIPAIPVTWSDLGLTGSVVYSTVTTNGGIAPPKIQSLDLLTGQVKTIFATSDNGWIYYLAVAPDASELIISYVPPTATGLDASTSLYRLPFMEDSIPQLLFTPSKSSERYIQVEWAPDGNYLYFVHYDQDAQPVGQEFPDYQISRMAYPDGQPEKILEHAFWPRVSPDSSRLVYVGLEPVTGNNQLFVSDADGGNAQAIQMTGAPQIVDAPVFSPDGSSILFSAPSPIQAYQPSWWDRLLGVQTVKAHDVPSDWWSVPVSGGAATRLTHIQTVRLFASISPDQKYIASMSGEGLLVMGLDGSNIRQIFFDPGISSVVNWIP